MNLIRSNCQSSVWQQDIVVPGVVCTVILSLPYSAEKHNSFAKFMLPSYKQHAYYLQVYV